MTETKTRELKLIQYLNEAYGTEKQLETALEAHIAMTTRAPYRKRLQQHLSETKRHARIVEQQVKRLGGKQDGSPRGLVTEAAQRSQAAAAKAMALAEGPLHAVRGTGSEEKQLKNAKTEYASEAQEIATYTAIETLADTVGDRETAKVAREVRREEERMARYLERLIPQLTRAVARAEIPASERRTTTRRPARRRRTAARATSRSRTARTASGSRTTSRATSRPSSSSRTRSRRRTSTARRS
jgi:ferritin-like metal-binding protein YciE